MENFSVIGGLRSGVSHRNLLFNLIKREIQARYRGTFLGVSWSVIYPLLMLGVYTFVFAGVYQSRWSHGGDIGNFVTMLFCGLIIFAIFSDVVNRAPTIMIANPNFVKKVIFPLELLPIVPLGASVFNALVSLTILLPLILFVYSGIPVTAVFTPLVFLPYLLMVTGISLSLAALGVFFRDLGQIVGIITSTMLFISPVFFPVSAAPAAAKILLNMNPLTYPIEELRHVLIMGIYPAWGFLFIYLLAALAVALIGLWLFQKSRSAFADVV